jgi:hypothetical protein
MYAIEAREAQAPVVGVHELAAMLGVSKQRASQYVRRPPRSFPEPLTVLAAGPVWLTDDVAAWLKNPSPRFRSWRSRPRSTRAREST